MGNKINAPAFMIAENPMTGSQLFIIHTGSPYVMAEVHEFHSEDENEILKCQQQYSIGGKTTFETKTALIGAVMMVPDEKFSSYSAQEQADKLASLMRRMSDWYYAFLKWEDEQANEE
jgi:hypothetical protein